MHSNTDKTSHGSRHPQPKYVLTPRDQSLLLWCCRHGIVTVDQAHRRYFSGKRAAYRRVAKLTDLGFLRSDPWLWNESKIIRVTRKGAALVSKSVRPARLVPSQIRHSLRLVDLMDDLE